MLFTRITPGKELPVTLALTIHGQLPVTSDPTRRPGLQRNPPMLEWGPSWRRTRLEALAGPQDPTYSLRSASSPMVHYVDDSWLRIDSDQTSVNRVHFGNGEAAEGVFAFGY